MTEVLCVFTVVTTLDRIHPWMETLPGKGRLLSLLSHQGALSGLLGHLGAQTDVFVGSQELLLASSSKQDPLLILKDGSLLSVDVLSLHVCHLPGHLKTLEDKFFKNICRNSTLKTCNKFLKCLKDFLKMERSTLLNGIVTLLRWHRSPH